MTQEELVERLADIEHLRWVRRTACLFSKCQDNLDGSFTIPSDLVAQWKNHMMHSYADMADSAREQVRDEVAHILPIIQEYAGGMATDAINHTVDRLVKQPLDLIDQAKLARSLAVLEARVNILEQD